VATVDGQRRTCDRRASRRCEQKHRPIKIRQFSEASRGYPCLELLARLAQEEVAVEVGDDVARQQCIDSDAVSSELKRHGLGRLYHARLRDRIRRDASCHSFREDGGHVDDAPGAASAGKAPRAFGGNQPGTLEICVQDRVPSSSF